VRTGEPEALVKTAEAADDRVGRDSDLRVTSVVDSGVAVITLGDGSRRNALRIQDWKRLTELIECHGAASDVAAIVIHGAGEMFCAGSDLSEWCDRDLDEIEHGLTVVEACLVTCESTDLPIVVAVEGVAAGAGCQLALAADIAVMADSALIGMPVARLAIKTSTAFVARVSRKTGKAVAADLFFTGRLLSADEARAAGLVARAVPAHWALDAAMQVARDLVTTPRSALIAAKRALGQVAPTPLPAPVDLSVVTSATVDHPLFLAAVRTFFSSRRGGGDPRRDRD
jgi:enoyl-CoA hydratase/carnithine racemase